MQTKREIKNKTEFDYTMMSDYQLCQRRYRFRHVEGLVSDHRQYAVEFGGAIHKALDSWYKDKDVNKAIEIFKADYEENPNEEPKRTHAMGEWILKNYNEQYKDQPFKVLATEHEFTHKLPNGNNLIGRIDKVVEWSGTIWIVDHKTTSQLGPQFFKQFDPTLQITGYVWAAKQEGFNCTGGLVDAILVAKGLLKSSTRGRLTPLSRGDVYVSDWKLDEWLDTVTKIQTDIKLSENNDRWVPNFNQCTYYGECPYRRICKEEPEIRGRVKEMDYSIGFWDPREES